MPLADNKTETLEENKKGIISKYSQENIGDSNYIPTNQHYQYRPQETIDDNRNRDNSAIIFPDDMTDDFYISFNAFKFSQDRFQEAKRNFSYEKSIYLPIPQSITDSFGATYTAENLFFVGNAIRNDLTTVASSEGSSSFNNLFSQGGMNRSVSRVADYIKSLSSDQGIQKAAASFGVAALSNPNMGILGAAAKTAFQLTTNPYPVMIYSGTGFKSFSFDWTFYPENPRDTEAIKKIVGYFRREMLPEQDLNNPSILKTPAIWEIVIKPDSHLKKFKRSVITSLDINYTPNGAAFIYSLSGGLDAQRVPAAVSVRVTFQEIEIWLANDFSPNDYDSFDYIETAKGLEANPPDQIAGGEKPVSPENYQDPVTLERGRIFANPTNIGG
jgi:hypothetical protein